MTEMLDFLPIPSERDFPVGVIEMRRDALVAAVAGDAGTACHPLHVALRAARGRAARIWLTVIGVFVVALAITLASLGGFQDRTATTSEIVAVTGTAQVVTLLGTSTFRAAGLGNEVVLRVRATSSLGVALPV